MYRIIYLPTADLVNAVSNSVTYMCEHAFSTKEGAILAINSHRVLYDTIGTRFIYLNSKPLPGSRYDRDRVPVHLLDVVEVD